jgi:CRISPR-associated endonuclease/helicase Cas3
LSATPGAHDDEAFSLTEHDRAHPQLKPRLQARKIASLAQIEGKLQDNFADHALRLCGLLGEIRPGRKRKKQVQATGTVPRSSRVAVVVNRVDVARRTFETISKRTKATDDGEPEKARVVLLTGRVRPLDRDRILRRVAPLLADPKRGEPNTPIILVATQTIEAGADLDVDALVTEIAPLDSLRQRFGRLDRLGARGESRATILHPKGKPSRGSDWESIECIYGTAAYETTEWLATLGREVDVGIQGFDPKLRELEAKPEKLANVLAPRRSAPVLLPAYADLWAMTWPAPRATPEPALFLHGPGMSTDIHIVWRADIVAFNPEGVSRANVSLELCPPSALEALQVPLWAARRWLREEQEDSIADVPDRAPDRRRDAPGRGRMGLRCDDDEWKPITTDQMRAGDLIVVPAQYGGCDEHGWNSDQHKEVTDLGAEANYRQRLRGALRITPKTLANALVSEEVTDAVAVAAEAWRRISIWIEGAGDEVEAEALRAALCDIEILPQTWLRLLNGHDGHRGIQGRMMRVVALTESDWLAGFVLYAERPLERGLLDIAATDEESEGEDSATDRDQLSGAGTHVELAPHLARVERHARTFACDAGLPNRFAELVGLAARLHDLGKADPRFQADLHGAGTLARLGLLELGLAPLLAKSDRRSATRRVPRATPVGFRHEALSVALAEQHPGVQMLPADERDLVLWLIGTHHGYGRPFFPPCSDPRPETEASTVVEGLPEPLRTTACEAPLRLDQGWFERVQRLHRRFGPWEIARLEAILRLADHVASAEEQRAQPDPRNSAEMRA